MVKLLDTEKAKIKLYVVFNVISGWRLHMSIFFFQPKTFLFLTKFIQFG